MSERLLKQWIRESLILDEATQDAGVDSPEELTPDPEISDTGDPEPRGLITWQEVLASGGLPPAALGRVKRLTRDGPTKNKTNQYGELGVVDALKALTGNNNWVQVGGGAAYDIELKGAEGESVELKGYPLLVGKYEAKTQAAGGPKGGVLARLGQAKAVEVQAQPSLMALKNLGSVYRFKIYGKYSDKKGKLKSGTKDEDMAWLYTDDMAELRTALEAAIGFFEGMWGPRGNQRWSNMMGLELAGGTVKLMKNLLTELKPISDGLAASLGFKVPKETAKGKGAHAPWNKAKQITVTSDEGTDTEEDDVKFKFEPITWNLDVRRVMKSRRAGSREQSAASQENEQAAIEASMASADKLKEAFKDLWTVMDRGWSDLTALTDPDFWKKLASHTQGDSAVQGIFTVEKNKVPKGTKWNENDPDTWKSQGFRFWTFPELTTTSITQGGRLVLSPIQESVAMKGSSVPLRLLIREMLRWCDCPILLAAQQYN